METDPDPRLGNRAWSDCTEKRSLKATEIAAGSPFPHARQMLQLTRTVTHRKTGARHTEVVDAITSLAPLSALIERRA